MNAVHFKQSEESPLKEERWLFLHFQMLLRFSHNYRSGREPLRNVRNNGLQLHPVYVTICIYLFSLFVLRNGGCKGRSACLSLTGLIVMISQHDITASTWNCGRLYWSPHSLSLVHVKHVEILVTWPFHVTLFGFALTLGGRK